MSENRRSVVWIDAHLEYRSPTMRHLLYALPHLRAEGWEIRVWCLRSDAPRDEVQHTFFPSAPWLGPLELLYFTLAVNVYGLWRWLCRKPRPATIIHATCGTYFGADLASVHFMNCVWLRKQLELGFANWKEVVLFGLAGVGAIFERLQWWSPALRKILTVSDSIGVEMRRRVRPQITVETLPNGYDESRFNPQVRRECRAAFRQKLGLERDDLAFIFVSLGHHKRKGFWPAVEAMAAVRRDPAMRHLKFVVVGGQPATLHSLQTALAGTVADWREWLVFAGQQEAVENYFAAADAFLYPSYFETFSLVALEAAAMGVPLLLTHFHGSEMMLEDGINGLFIGFGAGEIAEGIRRFVALGPSAFRHSVGLGLTRGQYAARLLKIYEGRLVAAGADGSSATATMS